MAAASAPARLSRSLKFLKHIRERSSPTSESASAHSHSHSQPHHRPRARAHAHARRASSTAAAKFGSPSHSHSHNHAKHEVRRVSSSSSSDVSVTALSSSTSASAYSSDSDSDWFEDGSGDETLLASYQPSIDYYYLPDAASAVAIDGLDGDCDHFPDEWFAGDSERVQDKCRRGSTTENDISTTEDDSDSDRDEAKYARQLLGLSMLALYATDSIEEENEHTTERDSHSNSSSPSLSPYHSHTPTSPSPSLSPGSVCNTSSTSSGSGSLSDSDNRIERSRSRHRRPVRPIVDAAQLDDKFTLSTISITNTRSAHEHFARLLNIEGTLALTGSDLPSAQAWRHLATFLLQTPRVSSLRLQGVGIGQTEIQALGGGALSFLRHLTLVENRISDAALTRAMAMLSSANDIHCVNVERNGVTSVDAIADFLEVHRTVETVCLSSNAIDDCGAVRLAAALSRQAKINRQSKLRLIDLQCNQITEKGIAALRAAERQIKTVTPRCEFRIECGGQRKPRAVSQSQPPSASSPHSQSQSQSSSPIPAFRSFGWRWIHSFALRPEVRQRAEQLAAQPRTKPTSGTSGAPRSFHFNLRPS